MNSEMKRLFTTKWQRKADIVYNGMQKTLTKVASATISLNALNMGDNHCRDTRKQGMQITADIITMLGQICSDITLKRKQYVQSVIKPQYKDLCLKDTTKVTNYLFGDNLTQLIKDVQIKGKIGHNNLPSHSRGSANYNYQSSNYRRRQSNQSFLGGWRGRNQNRASRNAYPQKQFQSYQHQKKQ